MESTQDLLANEVSLEMAGSGKRLANYLIDLASFYVVMFMLGIVLGVLYPPLFDYVDRPGGELLDRLFTLLLYGLYMGTVEALFKGKTLGKMITGTVAVNQDGTPLSAGTAFKRGMIRAIPFNALSGLGTPCHPWQDKWSDTLVVDIKKSILPAAE
ncbi:RDD family protein [Chitinophaga alhagiae]|uniref:RDD family protein n=1 Tax=Chitinophaga alhagiae TaxID=2203219 RepID=UPI000E5AB85D|nr:RDD family protein [Chitinophaga alhagiae]